MPQEYAPGLPDKHVYGEPTKQLKPGQLATYVLQHHQTKRRPDNPHFDLRIGSPSTNLFSWAIPGAELPEEGEKKLAPQTQLHTYAYGNFEGPIREGYGSGLVRMQDRGQALITKTTPNSIHFTIAHTKIPTRYALIRMNTGDGRDWLLIRKSMPKTVEGVGDKPKYKLIQADDVDEAMEEAQKVQEKIDGAHGIYQVGPEGKLEAYSVNPRVTGEPIVHTERLGLAGADVPKELAGTSLRGEMYGVGPGGKAIPFNEISGILNAGIAKSMETQRAKKVKMQNAIFGLTKYKGEDISNMAPEERDRLLSEVVKQLPSGLFHEPETARTSEEKAKLLTDIRTGKNKRTGEGVVMHMPGGAMWKYKIRPETTGYMTGTYPGEGKRKASAGGLTFGLEPGGPTIGQVGSGFTDAELAEIAKNVEEYKGKPMRLSHQGQFEETKKLRAPVFTGWETDKPSGKIASIKVAGGKVQVQPEPPLQEYESYIQRGNITVPQRTQVGGTYTNMVDFLGRNAENKHPWLFRMFNGPRVTNDLTQAWVQSPVPVKKQYDTAAYNAAKPVAGQTIPNADFFNRMKTMPYNLQSNMVDVANNGLPEKQVRPTQIAKNTPKMVKTNQSIGRSIVMTSPMIMALLAAQAKQVSASKKIKEVWNRESGDILPRAAPVGTSDIMNMSALKHYLKRYGKNPAFNRRIVNEVRPVLERKEQNAYFMPMSNKGDIPTSIIMSPGTSNKVYAHESGHALDFRHQLEEKGKAHMPGALLSALLAPIVGSKHTPEYLAEQKAWDLGGIKKDDPLRTAALGTYEAGGKSPEYLGRYGIPGTLALKMLLKKGAFNVSNVLPSEHVPDVRNMVAKLLKLWRNPPVKVLKPAGRWLAKSVNSNPEAIPLGLTADVATLGMVPGLNAATMAGYIGLKSLARKVLSKTSAFEGKTPALTAVAKTLPSNVAATPAEIQTAKIPATPQPIPMPQTPPPPTAAPGMSTPASNIGAAGSNPAMAAVALKRDIPDMRRNPPKMASDLVPLHFMDKDGNIKGELRVEIADTPTLRRMGLSKRSFLLPGHGMFFDKAGAYWMKDVNFPLDIVFIDKQGTILEKQHMPEDDPDQVIRPLYVPDSKEAEHAIELPVGWFEQHKLAAGDVVTTANPKIDWTSK